MLTVRRSIVTEAVNATLDGSVVYEDANNTTATDSVAKSYTGGTQSFSPTVPESAFVEPDKQEAYLAFDGNGYVTAPTLGNLLAVNKFRVTSKNVRFDMSLGGFWVTQSGFTPATREFTLYSNSGGLSFFWGGSETGVNDALTASEVIAEFGSAIIDVDELSLDIDVASSSWAISRDGNSPFKTGVLKSGVERIDGMLFRIGARCATDNPSDTSGGFIAPSGWQISDTQIFIDDVLVREYSATASQDSTTEFIDTVVGNNGTLQGFSGNPYVKTGVPVPDYRIKDSYAQANLVGVGTAGANVVDWAWFDDGGGAPGPTAVSNLIESLFSLEQRITSNIDSQFSLYQGVNNTRLSEFSLYQAVNAAHQTLLDLRQSVSSTEQILFDLRQVITSLQSISFDLFNIVEPTTVSRLVDTIISLREAVQKQQQMQFNLQQRVTGNIQSEFNLNQRITQMQLSEINLRSQLLQAHSTSFNLYNQAQNVLTSEIALRGGALNTINSQFDMRQTITQIDEILINLFTQLDWAAPAQRVELQMAINRVLIQYNTNRPII